MVTNLIFLYFTSLEFFFFQAYSDSFLPLFYFRVCLSLSLRRNVEQVCCHIFIICTDRIQFFAFFYLCRFRGKPEVYNRKTMREQEPSVDAL